MVQILHVLNSHSPLSPLVTFLALTFKFTIFSYPLFSYSKITSFPLLSSFVSLHNTPSLFQKFFITSFSLISFTFFSYLSFVSFFTTFTLVLYVFYLFKFLRSFSLSFCYTTYLFLSLSSRAADSSSINTPLACSQLSIRQSQLLAIPIIIRATAYGSLEIIRSYEK